MRIIEGSRKEDWVSSKDTVSFASPMNEVAADELGLLLKGHKIHGHNRNKAPNRSGSAPPSMEGSFSAFGNLVHDQSSSQKLTSLDIAMQSWQSEEQMRSDPSYFAYYNSNVNLNPRLPPPIISRENRHLAHHFADPGDSCQLKSSENSGDGSLHVTRSSLSTHDEEPEDENLPQSTLDGLVQSSASGQHVASFAGQHKSLVDLIQVLKFKNISSIMCILFFSQVSLRVCPLVNISEVLLNFSEVCMWYVVLMNEKIASF